VLAADVQVAHPGDQDRLRYALTGEAGLNDGTAFPFVMLGLGLMGLHHVGPFGWKWVAVDVVWATVGGLAIGAAAGTLVGRLVVYLRRTHREGVGLDDFLSLGLLALAYGAALAAHTYGFLAAFAAGLALRRVESASTQGAADQPPADVSGAAKAGDVEKIATDPKTAPAYMASAVLGFNEQLERMFEVAMVLLLGGMLTREYLPSEAIWFVPLLLLVIRPVAVAIGLVGATVTPAQRRLVSWFGIRGVGSIYYLMYAVDHGLGGPHAKLLTGLVFTAAVVSIAVHGVSVTPLMNLYERVGKRRADGPAKAPGGVLADDDDEPMLAGASGGRHT
jgi:NhaP-type Na+/H+ or K+/H+ antiporter